MCETHARSHIGYTIILLITLLLLKLQLVVTFQLVSELTCYDNKNFTLFLFWRTPYSAVTYYNLILIRILLKHCSIYPNDNLIAKERFLPHLLTTHFNF